jgi:hypothetical protein
MDERKKPRLLRGPGCAGDLYVVPEHPDEPHTEVLNAAESIASASSSLTGMTSAGIASSFTQSLSSSNITTPALPTRVLAPLRLAGPGCPGGLIDPAHLGVLQTAASRPPAQPVLSALFAAGPRLSSRSAGFEAISARVQTPSDTSGMPSHLPLVKNPAVPGMDVLDDRGVRERSFEFPEEEVGYHDYLYYPHVLETSLRARPAARRVSDDTGYLSFLCGRCMAWIRTHTYARDSFSSLTSHQSSTARCSGLSAPAAPTPSHQPTSACPGVSLEWPRESFHATYPYRQHSDSRLRLTWTPPSLRPGSLDEYYVWSVRCIGRNMVYGTDPCSDCLRVLPDIARKRSLALAQSAASTTKHYLLTPQQTDRVIAVKQKTADTSARRVSSDFYCRL